MSEVPHSAPHRIAQEAARRAADAATTLARQPTSLKNDALTRIAAALRDHTGAILEANARDLQAGRQKELSTAFLDRLELNEERIAAMASAVDEIAELEDPVGSVEHTRVRPNGLRVGKRRIPLGVIGIIYESRPNVTSDAAALCLKSGNGVLLKGGSDAFESNRAVYEAMRAGMEASRLPAEAVDAVGFVDTTDRSAVEGMLGLDEYIDVIIPRGGKGLIDFVTEHARMPVIKHDEGVCHVVVDGSARPSVVDEVVLNAKVQRPGVCNAVETLLVLESGVEPHLGRLLSRLIDAGVDLHGCPRTLEVASEAGLDSSSIAAADEEAYRAEFLRPELAVRVVEDLTAAIEHIDTFGSRHTEALLTENYTQSERFQREVGSSVVLINASTRFSDGQQLGLGAEIGISTTKFHAYGPMGLEALTTSKFVVLGDGQIRT